VRRIVMREFVDGELEGRWCGEKIIGVWLWV